MHREPPIPTRAIWRHLCVPLWLHHSRPMTMTSTTSPLCSSTYCSVLGGSIRSPFALRILISLLLTWFPAAGGGNTQHQTKKTHNLHRNHKLVLQSYLRVHICTTSGCVLITITCFNSPFFRTPDRSTFSASVCIKTTGFHWHSLIFSGHREAADKPNSSHFDYSHSNSHHVSVND